MTTTVFSRLSLLACAALVGSAPALAQVEQIQVIAPADVQLESTSSKAVIAGIEAAKVEARKNAWRVIKMRPDISLKVRNLSIEQNAQLAEGLKERCQVLLLNQSVDKKLKQLSTRFRFDCNQQEVQMDIDAILRSMPQQQSATMGARPKIATFFIVKEVAGVATYAPNVDISVKATGRSGVTASDKASYNYNTDTRNRTSVSESYGEGNNSVNDSMSQRDQNKGKGSASATRTVDVTATNELDYKSKGRTVNKAAEFKYRSASPEELNTTLTDVFKNAGVKITHYSDIVGTCSGPNPDAIAKEFGAKNEDLSTPIRTGIIAAARKCGFKYLAIGEALVDGTMADDVTGTPKYSTIIRAKVWNIEDMIPETLGSIQKDASASNSNANVARTNSVFQAAQRAGEEILSRLSAEGVR